MAAVTDGLSNTMFMSEVLTDTNNDHRGDFFNDDGGCNGFMTNNTPNSSVPDLAIQCTTNPAKKMPCSAGTGGGLPVSPPAAGTPAGSPS